MVTHPDLAALAVVPDRVCASVGVLKKLARVHI